jgi:hypothetical protein
MKAQFLGSTFLTILVRCPCGWKSFFDRAEWSRLRFMLCDNCRACIDYNSLRVTPTKPGEYCMHEFIETPERRAVIEDLEEAEARMESARQKLSQMGMKERAHKVGNYAQYASGMKHLLALDWRDEDKQRPAA